MLEWSDSPFNDCLRELLLRLTISPFQLHPNGYSILLGLCVLFRRTLNRFPSFDEIRFLCTFAKNKDHPSIILVRSARNRKLILDLPESAHGFLTQFFYVRCPLGFYAIWRVGSKITSYQFIFSKFLIIRTIKCLIPFFLRAALPSLLRDTSRKSILDTLNAVDAEERSAKFLLKDEFLHQFGLLHSSRSTQIHEVSSSDAETLVASDSQAEASNVPASVEETASEAPVMEAALVKCSASIDVVGLVSKSALTPITEEEENPRVSEKSIDTEVEKEKSAEHLGDDTFDGLSDIMITSQELFGDNNPKATSPVVEATSTFKQTQTPTTPVVSVSTLKRGL